MRVPLAQTTGASLSKPNPYCLMRIKQPAHWAGCVAFSFVPIKRMDLS